MSSVSPLSPLGCSNYDKLEIFPVGKSRFRGSVRKYSYSYLTIAAIGDLTHLGSQFVSGTALAAGSSREIDTRNRWLAPVRSQNVSTVGRWDSGR
ncbi:MAG: hypothetical protein JWN70_30 [Planctomycetaceae bacterium]|nr:hypothetical protein [Planctomycetaceae bacterium]